MKDAMSSIPHSAFNCELEASYRGLLCYSSWREETLAKVAVIERVARRYSHAIRNRIMITPPGPWELMIVLFLLILVFVVKRFML